MRALILLAFVSSALAAPLPCHMQQQWSWTNTGQVYYTFTRDEPLFLFEGQWRSAEQSDILNDFHYHVEWGNRGYWVVVKDWATWTPVEHRAPNTMTMTAERFSPDGQQDFTIRTTIDCPHG